MYLGVEKPDVTIDIMDLNNTVFSNLFGHTAPPHMALRVTGSGKVFWLENLNELKGYVTIRTPAHALTYVRLATSREMIYAGSSDAIEVSVNPDFDKGVDPKVTTWYRSG